MQYQTKSEEETKNLAILFAKDFLKTGGVIGLIGDLGAGKTTFSQGFAKGLKVKEKITSPTFLLMHQYQIPNSEKIFYHLDLYRLEGEINIKEIGLDEIFKNPDNIILIEWADKIKNRLPIKTLLLNFKKETEDSRVIESQII